MIKSGVAFTSSELVERDGRLYTIEKDVTESYMKWINSEYVVIEVITKDCESPYEILARKWHDDRKIFTIDGELYLKVSSRKLEVYDTELFDFKKYAYPVSLSSVERMFIQEKFGIDFYFNTSYNAVELDTFLEMYYKRYGRL